jgi:hypothetical protein
MRLYQPTQLVMFAAFAVLGAWLAPRHGAWPATSWIAGGSLIAAFLGAVLLRVSQVGQVTWRNRLAGWLLPFAGLFGAGQLGPLVASSVTVVTAAGAVGAFLGQSPWLAAGVGLDVLALLQLTVGAIQSRAARRLVIPIAVVGAALVAGVSLGASGRAGTGALVAAAPVVLAAGIPALYVLILSLMGRKIRWN